MADPSLDRPTVDCCSPAADPRVARDFDDRWSDWDDADGFPLIVDVSARLLDRLRDATLLRPSVLEIGCGTGGMSVALLEMGAARVRGIDLSEASVQMARRRASAAGFDGQATFEVGHGGSVGSERSDWVVIDRVLCCDRYPDRLLDAAIRAGPTRIALSVPESRGWRGLVNRPLWAVEAIWDLAWGGCRGYVHDVRRLERRLAAAGFRPLSRGHIGLWHVGVYQRDA